MVRNDRLIEAILGTQSDAIIALFNETCDELFDASVSEAFRSKAARIAESLRLALFYRPDRPWQRPQRIDFRACTMAFSSEVDAGSREDNASKQNPKAGPDSTRTKRALAERPGTSSSCAG